MSPVWGHSWDKENIVEFDGQFAPGGINFDESNGVWWSSRSWALMTGYISHGLIVFEKQSPNGKRRPASNIRWVCLSRCLPNLGVSHQTACLAQVPKNRMESSTGFQEWEDKRLARLSVQSLKRLHQTTRKTQRCTGMKGIGNWSNPMDSVTRLTGPAPRHVC